MRPKFWSSERISDTEVRKLWKRWKSGTPIRVLAERRGTTPENVQYLFRSRKLSLETERQCILEECDVTFRTKDPRKKACCKKHMKLALSRKERGATASFLPCALPECGKMVWMTHQKDRPGFGGKSGQAKRYCCTDHADLHSRRRNSGVYARLLKNHRKCFAPGCREGLILDEHHSVFKKGRSDKKSKIYWLCPTHHMKIHRGFADLKDGEYVDLTKQVLTGIKKKTKMFHRYTETLLK